MKLKLQAISLSIGLFIAGAASADPVKDNVAMELAFIKRVFETGYAPTDWKKRHFGWDLQAQYQKAQSELNQLSTVTASDYRRLITGFLTSPRDYHVGFNFFSTEASSLPFSVYGVNGKYFVSRIDRIKLNVKDYPIKEGDQLVTWDGRPIEDVMTELRAKVDWGIPTTDARLAELMLTSRRTARSMDVPQGRVDLVFKRANQPQSSAMQMTWEYKPETIDWNPSSIPSFMAAARTTALTETGRGILRPQMTWGMWESFVAEKDAKSEPNKWEIGGRVSYVPELGQVIWRTGEKEHFDAYIYRNGAGKLIGYIRIPHYSEDTKAFKEFRKIIAKMQPATDGLVIDEINNPGGSVFYVLALMSVLSDQPMKVPDHHITLWPALVDDILKVKTQMENVRNDADARKALGGDYLDGYPVNYQLARSVLDFGRDVEAAWKSKARLTTPLHLWGVDKVNPDPEVRYTKPIVVLVNELDFSGGDFFPAILQDNKRVKIFGQRTSGAGGYVLPVEFPSSLGLQGFSFTGSLARRVNNDPIENLGVVPDIEYSLTEKDLTENFVDYKAAINKAIQDLL